MYHDRFFRILLCVLCSFTLILIFCVSHGIRTMEEENALTRKTAYSAALSIQRELKAACTTNSTSETIENAQNSENIPTEEDAENNPSTNTSFWILREQDGILCVFDQFGTLTRNVGTSTALLPPADREALRNGIRVESEQELAEKIGDLTT